MAALLDVNTTAASSADFTLTGEASTLFLVSTAALPSGAAATVEVKSAAGVYYPIGALSTQTPIQVLTGPGVYRVSRAAGVSCGVDRY